MPAGIKKRLQIGGFDPRSVTFSLKIGPLVFRILMFPLLTGITVRITGWQ
jgi:hypothetical protein